VTVPVIEPRSLWANALVASIRRNVEMVAIFVRLMEHLKTSL
jgi:hypothetical protein